MNYNILMNLNKQKVVQFCGYIILYLLSLGDCSSWSEWWTYEGISGPEFWGLVNPEWSICSKGRRQSPIDIDPRHLLFDPHLKRVHVDKHRISGTLVNTGHDVKLIFDQIPGGGGTHNVNVSGGCLSYQYRLAELYIHFGRTDSVGSLHTINGAAFPAEIHILGYNSELYSNLTQAASSSNGLASISILVQIGDSSSKEFESIASHFRAVRYRDDTARVRHISINDLLPPTDDYLTYEGSLPQPGCQESTSWIILNKPIYITQAQLSSLREIMQGDRKNPKFPISNNFRETLPLHNRLLRTNIQIKSQTENCAVERKVFYQANVLGRS